MASILAVFNKKIYFMTHVVSLISVMAGAIKISVVEHFYCGVNK